MPNIPESEIDALANFLVLTNRISSRLQEAAALSNSIGSLADWLLLHSVRGNESTSMSDVARKIGVSRQRVHQQATELQASGLIKVAKSTDGKARQLSLTAKGRDVLNTVEKSLRQAIGSKEAFATQLQSARRSAGRLAKGLAPTAKAA